MHSWEVRHHLSGLLPDVRKPSSGIFGWGGQHEKDTHSVTNVPASTSLALPIPLGTGFCDAFLALSAGRDGRGHMGARGKEGRGEAEEALYWLWTGGRAEEGHVQRGKNHGRSGKVNQTKSRSFQLVLSCFLPPASPRHIHTTSMSADSYNVKITSGVLVTWYAAPRLTPSQPVLTAPQRLGRKADLAAFGLDAGRSPQVCHP